MPIKNEQFSGFSPEIIRQDFHAKIFSECSASALAIDVQEQVDLYFRRTVDDYCVSLGQVLAKMKNTIALLFLRRRWGSLLEVLHLQFMRTLVAKVPGRKVRRRIRRKPHFKLQTPAMGYPFNRKLSSRSSVF